MLSEVNNIINGFVWGKPGITLLICTGVFMTVRLRFFHFRYIGHCFRNTAGSLFSKRKHKGGHGAVSQFQAMCTALAATVGVGNIAGVASAICTGGPGAVFWMWVAAFFGMMTSYSENVLGIYYRRKNSKNEWCGGAMYYLRDGLGAKTGLRKPAKILASMFSVFCILASFGIGNMAQVNKITENIESAFRIGSLSDTVIYSDISLFSLIIGLVLMLACGIIILGGIERIAAVTEKIVPFMVIIFIVGSLAVIIAHHNSVDDAFSAIFSSAFTPKSAWGGITGFSVSTVITNGFKRGMFSNEAGLGSAVTVNCASDVHEPAQQGMWGIFEVFADTIIICTMTALVVLTSGVINLETGEIAKGAGTDSTLVASAFNTVFSFGDFTFGDKFIAIAIFLFAFTTILGWSHYGEKATEFIFGEKAVKKYKLIFTLMTAVGALLNSDTAWSISDTFNGLMMLPNLVGVLALSPTVVKITDNYISRNIKGNKNIKPMLSASDKIQIEQEFNISY